MDDIPPTSRLASPARALHFSYEKAGLTIADQPIPWNAEAVVVEATLRLPSPSLRRPEDFSLRIAGTDRSFKTESIRKLEASDPSEEHRYSVTFRLSPPVAVQTVEVLWQARSLGQLEMPVVGREEFLDGLRLQMPTVFVRIGAETVTCQTFVATQCRGLTASGVLTGPQSLAPLADLETTVEFRNDEKQDVQQLVARLNSSQLATRQTLVSAAAPQHPRHVGTWNVIWRIGGRELSRQRVRAISLRQFQRSLRVSDTRFVLQEDDGSVMVTRRLPPADYAGRIGPCFLVASREAGVAGLCPMRITAQSSGAARPLAMLDQDVLITDGLCVVAPGTLGPSERSQVAAFDLTVNSRSLCVLPMTPALSAAFNSEGGFQPPQSYSWSPAADDELSERLGRLLEERLKPR